MREDTELFRPRVCDSLLSPRLEREPRFCVELRFSLRAARVVSSRRGREELEREAGRSLLTLDDESESRRGRELDFDVACRDEVLEPLLASLTLEFLPVDVERSDGRRESLLLEPGLVLCFDDRRELDCDDLDDFD